MKYEETAPPQKGLVIGVTGITGSGTSTVSAILAQQGGYVISADKLAHSLMKKGQAPYYEILQAFGDGAQHTTSLLDPTGEINRRALGALVFTSPTKLKLLEAIMHPHVIATTQQLIEGYFNEATANFAVIDAPLLIEAGLHTICNSLWLVTAPDHVRLARIQARDNIDLQTATHRLNSRSGDNALKQYADIIIENNGDLESLRGNVLLHLGRIGER